MLKTQYLLKDKRWVVESVGGGYNLNYCHWIGRAPLKDFSTTSALKILENWHGSYAYIYETEQEILLIVDTIASFPLFYAVKNDAIYIADDAVEIAKKAKLPLNDENVSEYLSASYVTETETLFTGVSTLNPGTAVYIDKQNGSVRNKQWLDLNYTLGNTSVENKNRNYIKEFDDCLIAVFTDLAERLNGRKVLIPLSGGCDSRNVAASLKKVGYNNVFCLSYGKQGNFETERSRIVAKTLGFEWFWSEYKGEIWKNLLESEEYMDFIQYANVGSVIGCMQALPAMLDVKKRGLVPPDTVVVPGHALDLIMGNRIPINTTGWNKQNLINYILEIHYSLNNSVSNGNIKKWTNLIPDNISYADDIRNYYMLWEYRNRQTKFTAHDVRAYDFLGYGYEMPFWDSRIVKFASSLPFDLLRGRKFQYEYTEKVIDPMVGLKLSYTLPSTKRSAIKTLLKKSALVRYLLKQRSDRNKRFNNPCAFMEWMSDEQFIKYDKEYGSGFNLNSLEAMDYVNWLKKEIINWE